MAISVCKSCVSPSYQVTSKNYTSENFNYKKNTAIKLNRKIYDAETKTFTKLNDTHGENCFTQISTRIY